jgi:hypothetical protein
MFSRLELNRFLNLKDCAGAFTRVSILFSVFIIFVFSYLILMSRLLYSNSTLEKVQVISTPLHGDIPGLNVVGYIVPLFATLLLGIFRLRKVKSLPLHKFRGSLVRLKWWYLAAFVGMTISSIVPALSASGRADYPLTIVVSTFIAVNLTRGSMRDTATSSFVLGFSIGFISDLQSQVFFTGYFGGGGMLDGDFMLPVFLSLAAIVSRLLIEFFESRDQSSRVVEFPKAKLHNS